jgi:formamidopyrimidine-DNA glycosylase
VPELPDVAVFQQYLDSTALHQQIVRVEVGGRRILREVPARKLDRTLRGHCLDSTHRHGKYLFARISEGAGWLVLHFGMTGSLGYFEGEEGEDAAHRVLALVFEGRHRLVYDSKRKLGTVDLTDHPDRFVERKRLGPDALALDLTAFQQCLQSRRGGIKSLLMNQSVMAGLGNVYADEVLFHSGIHPKRSVASLGGPQVRRLFENLQKVLRETIEARADPARLPRSYLAPHRFRGEKCPRCGSALRTVNISGRTAWYCPKHHPEAVGRRQG